MVDISIIDRVALQLPSVKDGKVVIFAANHPSNNPVVTPVGDGSPVGVGS